jgi:hypothetical protein
MKFFRKTAEYLLFGHIMNAEVLEELKVETVDEKLRRYKRNCLQHVTRMSKNRMPKIMRNYRPNGRRLLGSPPKDC